jgi:transposase
VELRTAYTVAFNATEPTAEQIQAERERRSTFILLTSKRTLDARTALQESKAQDHNEQGFRWTKSPIHLGAFWLEKSERVTGLGYALLLALPFARFFRVVVRTALEDQPPLNLPEQRRVQKPSETVILDALCRLDIKRNWDGNMPW